MKNRIYLTYFFILLVATAFAQPPAASTRLRSPFRAYNNTQYTSHTELFAEYRPLLLNSPNRFTAHLTMTGETFKPYTDAEVKLTLTIGGQTAWQQTLKQPTAPGTYRFPVQSAIAGTGQITIELKTTTFTEKFVVKNVTVYTDTAAAITAQKTMPTEPEGLIPFTKERSWVETFVTAIVGKSMTIPAAAVLTSDNIHYVWVQYDPEHFRKQTVTTIAGGDSQVKIKGLRIGDRIITVGADKVKTP